MAVQTATKLYTAVLPADEGNFRQELRLWHPRIEADLYLGSGTYPRCWVLVAATLVAVEFTEYARALQEGLTERGVVRDFERLRIGRLSGPEFDQQEWRNSLCQFGSHLYVPGPRTAVRAFALGLEFVLGHPNEGGRLARIIRTDSPKNWEIQTAAAGAVIAKYPIAGTT